MTIHSVNGLFIDSKVKSGKLSCPLQAADRFTKSHEKWLTYLLTQPPTTWLQYGCGSSVFIKSDT